MSSVWALTPQQSIERECARRGRADLVDGCVRLIVGQDVDPALLLALGGPAAEKFLDGEEHADTYWLRVWGVRGLLWAGDLSQLDAVRTALADESWRVRELAAKVVARHLMGEALDRVAALRDDPVARGRVAAARAVEVVTHQARYRTTHLPCCRSSRRHIEGATDASRRDTGVTAA